jgi:hypothetical protein
MLCEQIDPAARPNPREFPSLHGRLLHAEYEQPFRR